MFEILEKKINNLMRQIELGKITKQESGVGRWINQMKSIDEPCHEQLMERYKKL